MLGVGLVLLVLGLVGVVRGVVVVLVELVCC